MIVAIPVRLLHMIYPLAIGTIFVLFNLTYYKLGGRGPDHHNYTYYMLNWTNAPRASSTVFIVLLLCILVQMIIFGWYRFRVYIYRQIWKCKRKKEESEETQEIVDRWDPFDQYQSMDHHQMNATDRW